jgi:hypothetical protein
MSSHSMPWYLPGHYGPRRHRGKQRWASAHKSLTARLVARARTHLPTPTATQTPMSRRTQALGGGHRSRRLALVALLAVLGVGVLEAAQALAISTPIQITNTGGEGVYIRSEPNTSSTRLGWMPEDASPGSAGLGFVSLVGPSAQRIAVVSRETTRGRARLRAALLARQMMDGRGPVGSRDVAGRPHPL